MHIDFDPSGEESSLGKYLKSIREEKEISLEDLAEATKIKLEYLEAIEADKYDILPKGPYLTLFLKSYSEALDIDYLRIRDYMQSLSAISKPARARPSSAKSGKTRRKAESKPAGMRPDNSASKTTGNGWETKNYLGLIGILVFIAFIIIILIIIISSGESKDSREEQSYIEEHQNTAATSDSAEIMRENFLMRFDSLTLSIYPTSQQWFSIKCDDQVMDKVLNRSEVYTFSAYDSISIGCERADSSRFYLNGYRINIRNQELAEAEAVVLSKANWIDFVDTLEKE